MWSQCLFTRQLALKIGYFKIGYFNWLRVKSSNYLHTELSHGYLKGTKFYLESKASVIDLKSIGSFKLFTIAWLREYYTFLDSSVVNLKSLPWPKYAQWRTILQKKKKKKKKKNRGLLSNYFPLQIC